MKTNEIEKIMKKWNNDTLDSLYEKDITKCKEEIGIKFELENCGKTEVLLTLAFRVFSFQIALKI